MMVLQDTVVRISSCNRMLSAHNELVGVAWVLIIVDQVC